MPRISRGARVAGKAKTYGGRYRRYRKVSTKNTPFRRYNAGGMVRRAKTKSLIKLVKNVQLSQVETCYKTTKFAMAPVPSGQNYFTGSVNHNSLAKVALWQPGSASFPLQGLTDGERRGDEIYLTGIKVRLVMQIPYDRRNSKFRFYYIPWNTVQGDPSIKSNLFHGTINNVMVDAMQTDRYSIRKLGSARLYSTDQNPTSQDKTITKTFWIPIKRKIKFVNDGVRDVAQGLKEEGTIVITGYDSITALETDTICTYMEAAMTVYYKDP